MLGVVGICIATPVFAGAFAATPVRIYMTPKDRAAAVTLTNDGDEELVIQTDIYAWRQKADGQDDLTLSEDLFLAPPIIKMPAKSQQVVRLILTRPPTLERQLTYRMIVREIPEAKPAEKVVQISIGLAFSMPVFVTPPGAKSELGCTVGRVAADAVKVNCQNTGNAYAQIRELSLNTAEGSKLTNSDLALGYLLPDVKRSFDLKRKDGKIPAGKASLVAALDDGTSKTFDVTIGE